MIELKAVQSDDANTIFQAWGRYSENFTYLTARAFVDVSDARRYIVNLFPSCESKAFHIVAAGSGIIGIVKATIVEHRAQIGYVVHNPFCGQGFATAAVRELTQIVEADAAISRVWATCALDNLASVRVLEKAGFALEAVLKNWATYPAQGEQPFDNYCYVRIKARAD